MSVRFISPAITVRSLCTSPATSPVTYPVTSPVIPPTAAKANSGFLMKIRIWFMICPHSTPNHLEIQPVSFHSFCYPFRRRGEHELFQGDAVTAGQQFSLRLEGFVKGIHARKPFLAGAAFDFDSDHG